MTSRAIRRGRADTTWMLRAACRGRDTEMFFDESMKVWAKRICAQCPVADLCLGYAKTTRSVGIWGGQTEFERMTPEAQRKMLARRWGYTHKPGTAA